MSVALDAGIILRVNTTRLERSGDWVEIRVEGVKNPRYDDMIALFPSTALEDFKQTSPLKYHFAVSAPGYMETGSGILLMRLLNIRQPQHVALVRDGLEYPSIAARSAAIVPSNVAEPTQIHVALTQHADRVRVQWVSAGVAGAAVRWGRVSEPLDREVPASSAAYSAHDLCGSPANLTGWIDPGELYSAVLSGLVPGRRYEYVVGSDAGGWSAPGTFVAAPGPDEPVEFIALADLGQTEADGSLEVDAIAPASRSATSRLEREARATLLVLEGDLSYARGYGIQWETFYDQLAPVLRRMPMMTVVGNHERDWPGTNDRFGMAYDSGGECGVPYERRTGMPAAGPDRPWYAFDYGPVHLLQYSTEHAFEPGSEQYAFIAADLAAVDRARTPWVVVGGHRPIYVDSTFDAARPDADQYVARRLREALEPLFLLHGVDATWHGHHHSYQRTCSAYRDSCVADGCAPVHLVLGHAGAELTPNTAATRPRVFQTVQLEHGYVRVRASRTRLEQVTVSSRTGEVMDRLVLRTEDRAARNDAACVQLVREAARVVERRGRFATA